MCIRKCLLFRLNFDQLLHPWFHYTQGVYIMKISFKQLEGAVLTPSSK